jgi:hypothetical protein
MRASKIRLLVQILFIATIGLAQIPEYDFYSDYGPWA